MCSDLNSFSNMGQKTVNKERIGPSATGTDDRDVARWLSTVPILNQWTSEEYSHQSYIQFCTPTKDNIAMQNYGRGVHRSIPVKTSCNSAQHPCVSGWILSTRRLNVIIYLKSSMVLVHILFQRCHLWNLADCFFPLMPEKEQTITCTAKTMIKNLEE